MKLTKFVPSNIKLNNIENKNSLIGKNELLKLTNSNEIGFLNFPSIVNQDYLQNIKSLAKKFQSKKHFIHVGLGGSSLGPQMLLEALSTKIDYKEKDYFFINNSDPDLIANILKKIDIKESLFFIVSKSGSTIETMAAFSIILQKLDQENIKAKSYQERFIFCTDPKKSELLEISKEFNIENLVVPSNIGGRFSVLADVGLFPLAFFNLDIDKLIQGANQIAMDYQNEEIHELDILSQNLVDLYLEYKFDQTVIMPYSNLLKPFSDWFVQLWAESLGKDGKGLTPISSYGATDQHSQLQLFLEGPKSKFILTIGIDQYENNFDLKTTVNSKTFEEIKHYNLGQIINAQRIGVNLSCEKLEIPYANLQIDSISEFNLGSMVMYFEILTAITGLNLKINPFDQPGVEVAKKLTLSVLKK